MMIFLVDSPELFNVSTVERVALRRLHSLSKESLAINSFSDSVILLFLSDSFVVLKPVDVLFYFYDQVSGHKK